MTEAHRGGGRETGKAFPLFVTVLFGLTLVVRVLWSGVTFPESNVLILLVLSVLLASLLIGSALGRGVQWRFSLPDVFFLLYLGVVACFYFSSPFRWLGRDFLVQMAACTAAYLLASCLAVTRGGRVIIFSGLCAGAVIVSLYGLYQYYWGFAETRSLLGDAVGAGNRDSAFLSRLFSQAVFSTFFFSNAFAGYLVVVLPSIAAVLFLIRRDRPAVTLCAYLGSLAAGAYAFECFADLGAKPYLRSSFFFAGASLLAVCLVTGRRGPTRWAAACCIPVVALPLWALLLTASEAAWLALALSIVLVSLFLGRRSGTAAVTLAVLAVLLAVVVGADLLPPGIRDSLETRGEYWRAGARIWAEQPLTGCGPGVFPHAYARVRGPTSEEGRMPHSIFLHVAGETGLIGLAAFIGLWSVYLIKVGREARGGNAVCIGVLFSICAFLLHGAVGVGLSVPATTLVLWTLAGAGMAAVPARAAAGRSSRIVVLTAGFLAAAFTLFWIVPEGRATLRRLEAEKEMNEMDWEGARAASVAALALDRANPDYWSLYARVSERSGDNAGAEKAYRKAAFLGRGLAPYHARLAAFYWRISAGGSDPDYSLLAVDEITEAIRANPCYVDYRLLKSFWKEKGGEPAEALLEYGTCFDLIKTALTKPKRIRRHTPAELERLREMVGAKIDELQETLSDVGKE